MLNLIIFHNIAITEGPCTETEGMESEQLLPNDRITTSLPGEDVSRLRPGATNPWTSDESEPQIQVILAEPNEQVEVGKVDIPNENSNVEEYVVYVKDQEGGQWVPLLTDDNGDPLVS